MGVRVHEDRGAKVRRNAGGGRLKEQAQDLAGTLAVTTSAGVELGDRNVGCREGEGHELERFLERHPVDHRCHQVGLAQQTLWRGIPGEVDIGSGDALPHLR
ncbi:hypothetical protein GVY41_13900 [Frigidibacter albus]|uniref:hypothetical protein n=1 Tax=Frigidibacter albus TaxID=1465486 RepID=UPI00136B90A7|nr:hypothetical protein [Frigidibacter albus]NBE32089.1 hypothetical protein [Frigidibacter albus]GGH56948.1 hypothetical protein GCM10011341_25910 [Frigidibacter albus]